VTQSPKYLLIGSIEPYSGKTGVIVGIAHQLLSKHFKVAYSKPIDSSSGEEQTIDADFTLMAKVLNIPFNNIKPPLIELSDKTIYKKIANLDSRNYLNELTSYLQSIEGDIVLIEGTGSLDEGLLFDLSIAQVAQKIDSPVLLVVKGTSPSSIDKILKAKLEIGEKLIGIVLNGVRPEQTDIIQSSLKPYLNNHQIPILGIIPQSSLLASVSVREITKQLKAKVLCRQDRLDLMVESLMIGAMNVNAALEYFRKSRNKAVVTGSDRTDLHFAALETSTSCLILTGTTPPDPILLSRAEDLEVPVLSVNLDTLTTIEIIENTFGKVRLQEDIKMRCIQELMDQHFAIDSLLEQLKLN